MVTDVFCNTFKDFCLKCSIMAACMAPLQITLYVICLKDLQFGMQNKKKQLVSVSDKDACTAYATKMKGNKYFALSTSTITEKEMEKESVCCDPVTANVAED